MKILRAEIRDIEQSDPRDFHMPAGGGDKVVVATFEDGTTKPVLAFYSDEISFGAEECVGKTEEELHEVKFRKDKAYLRS